MINFWTSLKNYQHLYFVEGCPRKYLAFGGRGADDVGEHSLSILNVSIYDGYEWQKSGSREGKVGKEYSDDAIVDFDVEHLFGQSLQMAQHGSSELFGREVRGRLFIGYLHAEPNALLHIDHFAPTPPEAFILVPQMNGRRACARRCTARVGGRCGEVAESTSE